MQVPSLPSNEKERLESVRSLNILDTEFEERFDRLTRLATRLFGVPMAMVSIIDENRQWFKSCVGAGNTREGPRDISFCGHAILGQGIMMVPDATKDERFNDNPLVLGAPNIRFYAGRPITVKNNRVGTLCLIDNKPRTLNNDELTLFDDLAGMVEQEMSATLMATMDDLTHISNRRGFTFLAQHAFGQSERLKIPSRLVFFDLDSFKQINDTHGHAEGDYVLTTFAKLLQDTFRQSDVIGRLGGDEFAVFESNPSATDQKVELARLEKNIAAHNVSSQKPYAIKFSAGFIDKSDKHHTLEDMIKDADALMYENKSTRKQAAAR